MDKQKVNHERKRQYEPPRANFVPLKMEERLLRCGKTGEASPSCRGQDNDRS